MDKNTKDFAEACYEQNSIEELVKALKIGIADKSDMKEWNINSKQWKNAIASAIIMKGED